MPLSVSFICSSFYKRFFFVVGVFVIFFSIDTFAQNISKIKISGNNVTKPEVIIFEIGVNVGDTLNVPDYNNWKQETENRLMKTSLFLLADVEVTKSESGDLQIDVEVKERWYYWVYPILEYADRNLSSFLYSKDWSRINYGVTFEKHNFRGYNEFLKVKLRLGYRYQFGIMYDKPMIKLGSKLGGQISFNYFQQRKALTEVNDDKPIYRFFENDIAIEEYRSKLVFHYRINKDSYFHLSGQHQLFRLNGNLVKERFNYLYNNDSMVQFFSLSANYSLDKLDDKYFPLRGQSLNVGILKRGFTIHDNINDLEFNLDYSIYFPISSNWYISSELYFFTHAVPIENIPFRNSFSLGFGHYPRGYENNVIQSYMAFGGNQSLRYQVYNSPLYDLRFIPLKQFRPFEYQVFLSAFCDFAYAHKQLYYSADNVLSDRLLASVGLGLDFVTYYDRSLGVHIALTNQNAFGIFVALRSPMYKVY